jgi:CD36 family.
MDHDNDDTVSFNPQDTWFFNGEKSEGLTGDEMLTVPHTALLVRTTQKPSHLHLMLHRLFAVSFRFYEV